jgi:negative regulator of sigma E activity
MTEMLDSQLSAMFDDELPATECELVARRLSRDETLQGRWRNYALIGAAIRGERGLALEVDIASRVRKAVDVEGDLPATRPAVAMPQSRLVRRAWQGVAGVGIAAGVAAISILWLRAQTPAENSQAIVAQVQRPAPVRAAPSGPDSYVVPRPVDAPNAVPSAELANYVLSHSEYSGPLIRRNVLSSLVASETGTVAPSRDSEESVKTDADNP